MVLEKELSLIPLKAEIGVYVKGAELKRENLTIEMKQSTITTLKDQIKNGVEMKNENKSKSANSKQESS